MSLPREDRVPIWKRSPLFPVAVLQVLGLDDPAFDDDAWTGFNGPVDAGAHGQSSPGPLPPSTVGRFSGAALAVACAAGKKAAAALWGPRRHQVRHFQTRGRDPGRICLVRLSLLPKGD